MIAIFSFRYDAHLVPDLIENLRPIIDGYVAYDDRGASEAYTDERARKAVLREAAREMGAQWLLCIDPDERLEMAAAERRKTLTHAIEPVIWTFRLREMYTPTAYRVDGRWNKKRVSCLFPVLDGQVFSDAPLHGRRNPLNPEYVKRDSGLNLYHLKMITAERREARRDFYKKVDPKSEYQKIGYDYLGDETGLALEEIPPSRLYAPLYQETGRIWQPDLSALRPISSISLQQTASDTPHPENGVTAQKATAPRQEGRRLIAAFRQRIKQMLGAVVGAFPSTADRAALFILTNLAGRPLKDRWHLARLRELVDKRTPSKATRKRGGGLQASKTDQIPARLARRIKSLFADPPVDWAPEDQIFLMRALRRLDLLTEWDFHVLLTRLLSERRTGLFRSLIEDDSLGFDLVRGFHRLRLLAYSNDGSLSLAALDELRRRAKGSFLYWPATNEFLNRAIVLGALDDVEREIVALGSNEPLRIRDDVIIGACRLLGANGRPRAAALLLERHLAPLDEEQRLRFLQPLLRLDELGALSPGFSAYCASFRPEISVKATERLAKAYVAVDEVDRAQFDRFVVAKLRALEEIKPNLMNIRFSPEQRRVLIGIVIGKLKAKEPLSLIRLGDGEAYLFPEPHVEGRDPRAFADAHALRERHWWGVSPPSEAAAEIRRSVLRAVEDCDIIGLPSVHRILRVIARPKMRFGASHQARGLMSVLAAYGGAIPLNGKIVTEERCHHCALDRPALDAMFEAAERVVVVSCWSEAQLRVAAGRARHIVVSPAQKVKHLASSGGEKPIFESYREIAAKVRAESGPGTLVLVGAGVVGKIFIDEARQAGAVALDVGSLLDYLAGHHTRILADMPALMNSHGDSASVSAHTYQ